MFWMEYWHSETLKPNKIRKNIFNENDVKKMKKIYFKIDWVNKKEIERKEKKSLERREDKVLGNKKRKRQKLL
jgi:hypothetical protein